MVDVDAAERFMAGHARLLDRQRFDVLFRGAPGDGALAALSAYANPDGGLLDSQRRRCRVREQPRQHDGVVRAPRGGRF